ncbi:MAG: hypothetical protein R2702_01295 [Acidimicrobiales bacterium]
MCPRADAELLDANSKDTLRSRSWTGKPCRMLRNDWTEAWEAEGNPKPLGMPMQFMVTSNAVQRGQGTEHGEDTCSSTGGADRESAGTRCALGCDVIFDMVEEASRRWSAPNAPMNQTAECIRSPCPSTAAPSPTAPTSPTST